jgi:hypothetical protein
LENIKKEDDGERGGNKGSNMNWTGNISKYKKEKVRGE